MVQRKLSHLQPPSALQAAAEAQQERQGAKQAAGPESVTSTDSSVQTSQVCARPHSTEPAQVSRMKLPTALCTASGSAAVHS